jgi:thiamine-monophosphate kinase
LGKHLEFEPRVKEAARLLELAPVNAMMDISDGLSSDLLRICRASGVGAVIEADLIPISEAAMGRPDPLESALNEGEDFELLFTLPAADWPRLERRWDLSTRLSRIGLVAASGALIRMGSGQIRPLEAGGYDHIR